MILSDTDILSALAKIRRIDLLYLLFEVNQLYITPAVHHELEVARNRQFSFSQEILKYISAQKIAIIFLTPTENIFAQNLPLSLGAGERESIAIAYERKNILLSNESRVAHWCHRLKIESFDLSSILRGLWIEGILTQDEVRELIAELHIHDRMSLSARTMAAIFAPKQ